MSLAERLAAVLAEHVQVAGFDEVGDWHDYGCDCSFSGTSDADYRTHVATMQAGAVSEGLRQVWCVTYDSPNPSMDGPHPLRMADQDYEIAVRNYEFMQRQQRVSPKRNLRIETRWVSDYTDATPEADRFVAHTDPA